MHEILHCLQYSETMELMVLSLVWTLQDFGHQQYAPKGVNWFYAHPEHPLPKRFATAGTAQGFLICCTGMFSKTQSNIQ